MLALTTDDNIIQNMSLYKKRNRYCYHIYYKYKSVFCSYGLNTYNRIHINRGAWISPISRSILNQFSKNLHTVFSIHVVTTRKISRSFDKYLRS